MRESSFILSIQYLGLYIESMTIHFKTIYKSYLYASHIIVVLYSETKRERFSENNIIVNKCLVGCEKLLNEFSKLF